MARFGPTAAVLCVGIALTAACGGGSGDGVRGAGGSRPVPPEAGAPLGTKTADPVVQAVAQVAAARAKGGAGLAGVSSALVHVRSDGAIEVVAHTAAPVGAAELDQLRRLRAEVVTTVTTPSVGGQPAGGQVQMWVPAEQVAAVDALPWVAAVTPPSYGSSGG